MIEAIIILALCGGAFVWAASHHKSRLNAFAERVAEVDAAAHRVVTEAAARVGLKLLSRWMTSPPLLLLYGAAFRAFTVRERSASCAPRKSTLAPLAFGLAGLFCFRTIVGPGCGQCVRGHVLAEARHKAVIGQCVVAPNRSRNES